MAPRFASIPGAVVRWMLRVHSPQWWCIFYFLLASPNTGPCPASPESLDTHSFQDPHNCVVILPQVISPPPSFFQRCGLVAVSLVKVTPTEASATSTFLNCYTTSKCFRQCSQTWHFGSASAKLDQLLLLTQPPLPPSLWSPVAARLTALGHHMARLQERKQCRACHCPLKLGGSY